jgi:hypothetical protein
MPRPSSPSEIILALGRRVLTPYANLPGVACAALTGSAAEGLSDHHSDLDSTVYYDTLPPEDQIRAIREQVRGSPLKFSMGSYADGEFIESFYVDGVECQVGHTTVAKWESDIAKTLAGEDPASPLHKAMSGTLISIAIRGNDRLETWKARIRTYPDTLRLAMVRHHLKFFPIWGVLDRTYTRDGALWMRQVLVESSFNLIGVAAGLSRKYFTPFQFKRATLYINGLTLKPNNLAQRVEALWTVPIPAAASDLRQLVTETTTLVERELPEADTAAVHKALDRNDKPWA